MSQSGKERLPSQFVEEMKEVNEVDTSEFEKDVSPEVFLQKLPEGTHLSVADKDYLKELFVEQGLSVTALNNYLTCPWNYFYSNLIRIPKIPNKHMLLGTVVHKALNTFFNSKGNKDTLLVAFNEALKRTALSGSAYDEIKERGIDALDGWFDHYTSWHEDTVNEYRVDTVAQLNIEELPQIRIRGDLDKIEMHKDGVTVVDYKTGAPKSRNHLLGETKAKDSGNYFRQLVFYKMLLDNEGRYVMKKGVVDFIQPKSNGKYIKEEFEITPENVDKLMTEITQMTKEVLDMSFWDTRCDDKDCEYCKLRDVMN
ncbi:hypothetical protein COB52_02580 [Candidatus Kaiserbacteria bacterium]|nr:MAG: hypothetical protein COB52_02580 [Candidatus Kaiserbacteria bacterium]